MVENGEAIFGTLGDYDDVVVIDRKMFNKVTDAVALNMIDELRDINVFYMAKFVRTLRGLLFDTYNKTEKEEN